MDEAVIEWLLDSDPAIRWHVRRDLLDAPDDRWQAERPQAETEGWGAALLSHQDDDGQWGGGSFLPTGFTVEEWHDVGQPWTATVDTLNQLRELGFDPDSGSQWKPRASPRAGSRCTPRECSAGGSRTDRRRQWPPAQPLVRAGR